VVCKNSLIKQIQSRQMDVIVASISIVLRRIAYIAKWNACGDIIFGVQLLGFISQVPFLVLDWLVFFWMLFALMLVLPLLQCIPRHGLATDDCSICWEDRLLPATMLICRHMFHTMCIQAWFLRSQTCPLCRSEL
jgi:hypothetical protein